jgi:hypothetical protein
LSRAQYAIDIERWGYQDARLLALPGKTAPAAVRSLL